ncbi:MAG: hypothetical protein DRN05_04070 [Thermoplasmata archaeon]|nr:MAG: hypothetical protein DRN05_04070 [Thermoplasmata archaeon]
MKVVKEGDKVLVLCEARLENGEICYKNEKEEPLELIVGRGKLFPAVENALKNMKEGETKELTLEPEQAFGPHLDDLVLEVPKSAFRQDVNLNVGSRVEINTPSGKVFYGTITNLSDDSLTVDLNHPLAGKKIIFIVTLVSIE